MLIHGSGVSERQDMVWLESFLHGDFVRLEVSGEKAGFSVDTLSSQDIMSEFCRRRHRASAVMLDSEKCVVYMSLSTLVWMYWSFWRLLPDITTFIPEGDKRPCPVLWLCQSGTWVWNTLKTVQRGFAKLQFLAFLRAGNRKFWQLDWSMKKTM